MNTQEKSHIGISLIVKVVQSRNSLQTVVTSQKYKNQT